VLGFQHFNVAALIDLNSVMEHMDGALAEPRTPVQARANQIAEIETFLATIE